MSKYGFVSGIFLILGLLAVAGVLYMVLSYAGATLNAMTDFVTTNDFTVLKNCGVNPPEQFDKIKSDLPTVILPFLYLGLPLSLILISVLMFLAGKYNEKGGREDEERRKERIEGEAEKKVIEKLAAERPPPPPPTKKTVRRKIYETETEAPEEEQS